MTSSRVKGALTYLMTRPARPRYQERTMTAGFIAEDASSAVTRDGRERATARRMGAFGAELARNTSGGVHAAFGPVFLCGLVLIALGATAVLR